VERFENGGNGKEQSCSKPQLFINSNWVIFGCMYYKILEAHRARYSK
jgi:hypothetical protein